MSLPSTQKETKMATTTTVIVAQPGGDATAGATAAGASAQAGSNQTVIASSSSETVNATGGPAPSMTFISGSPSQNETAGGISTGGTISTIQATSQSSVPLPGSGQAIPSVSPIDLTPHATTGGNFSIPTSTLIGAAGTAAGLGVTAATGNPYYGAATTAGVNVVGNSMIQSGTLPPYISVGSDASYDTDVYSKGFGGGYM